MQPSPNMKWYCKRTKSTICLNEFFLKAYALTKRCGVKVTKHLGACSCW